jgi:hypothetical protein
MEVIMSKKAIVNIIEGKYRVVIDDYNHTLQVYNKGGQEVRNPKTGEMSISKARWGDHVHPYYPSVKQAIAAVIGSEVLTKDESYTLSEYYDKLSVVGKEIGGRFNV